MKFYLSYLLIISRQIYIVMEYCNAGDLSTFIKRKNKLPENVCRKFLQQLALALKYLRSNNVCHMDLKPQNLLLIRKPTLRLKVGGLLLKILFNIYVYIYIFDIIEPCKLIN